MLATRPLDAVGVGDAGRREHGRGSQRQSCKQDQRAH
jgi:hypothetical protein